MPAFTCCGLSVSSHTSNHSVKEKSENGCVKSKLELTFGWRETLVMSWSNTNVHVMKKILRRQVG